MSSGLPSTCGQIVQLIQSAPIPSRWISGLFNSTRAHVSSFFEYPVRNSPSWLFSDVFLSSAVHRSVATGRQALARSAHPAVALISVVTYPMAAEDAAGSNSGYQQHGDGTLIAEAVRILRTADPWEKAELGRITAERWFNGGIREAYISDTDASLNPESVAYSVPDKPARDDSVSKIHVFWLLLLLLLLLIGLAS